MPHVTFKALRARFKKETGFRKLLNREWPDVSKKISAFAKGELVTECGGTIRKNTTKRNFRRLKEKYESLFYRFINDLIKKDNGAKVTMFAEIGSGPQTLGAGHIYWMKDITGDLDELQEEYGALDTREQGCATWLQETTRDFLLFGLEKVVSEELWASILEDLRVK